MDAWRVWDAQNALDVWMLHAAYPSDDTRHMETVVYWGEVHAASSHKLASGNVKRSHVIDAAVVERMRLKDIGWWDWATWIWGRAWTRIWGMWARPPPRVDAVRRDSKLREMIDEEHQDEYERETRAWKDRVVSRAHITAHLLAWGPTVHLALEVWRQWVQPRSQITRAWRAAGWIPPDADAALLRFQTASCAVRTWCARFIAPHMVGDTPPLTSAERDMVMDMMHLTSPYSSPTWDEWTQACVRDVNAAVV